MGATRSTMDKALKDIYLERYQSTINTDRVLMSRLEKNAGSRSVSGRQAIVPVNIQGTEAITSTSDGGALPTAQNQTFVECAIPYRYMYGTIEVTHPTIVSTRNDEGAWVRVLSAEMDGLMRDMKNDVNRQLHRDGTGHLGTVVTGATATTATLDSGHKVRPNMFVDVWDAVSASSSKEVNNIKITAVSGNVITFASSQTFSSNAIVTRAGVTDASTSNPVYYEMMGILGVADDGTFISNLQGIARGTYEDWNSVVLGNSGTARPITEALLDDSLLQVEDQRESDISIGITSRIQFRKIANLMVPDRRYTDTMELAGGFKAISWAGKPIVWDRDMYVDANANDWFAWLDESELSFYELADWAWDDEDGNVLHRVEGYAKYRATLYKYCNLGTMHGGAHVAIRDLDRS